MPITLNGTTGYLEHGAKIVSGYPCSMVIFGTRASSSGSQFWIAQQQSNNNRYLAGWHLDSSDGKYATAAIIGNNDGAGKATAPNTSTTALKMMTVVFTSAISRTIYFGDSSGVTSTASITDEVTNHDRCTIGALHYNSGAAAFFSNGAFAEAHWFNTALTTGQIDAMIADTTKPEDTTGWVDGWTLKDYEAGGTYTSIGGTRTMTAVGGVSSSALAHPLSRASTTSVSSDLAATYGIVASVSSNLAATYTIDSVGQVSSNLAATYGIVASVSSNLAATYAIAAPTATIAFDDPASPGSPLDFGKNTAAYYFDSAAVTVYFNLASTNALIATASLTTNSDATLNDYSDAAFVSGTSYRCVFKFADGSEGMATLAAA
jgi:hypothetical protein